jgi:uncharacterized DUF497 family protein
MDIGYVWDEDKYARVQTKHDVGFDEVVAAFEDEKALYWPDPGGNADRQMVVGKTRQGRILQAIFTYENAPLVRIITAFDASQGWKNEYVR